jgi:hypothetical protein
MRKVHKVFYYFIKIFNLCDLCLRAFGVALSSRLSGKNS